MDAQRVQNLITRKVGDVVGTVSLLFAGFIIQEVTLQRLISIVENSQQYVNMCLYLWIFQAFILLVPNIILPIYWIYFRLFFCEVPFLFFDVKLLFVKHFQYFLIFGCASKTWSTIKHVNFFFLRHKTFFVQSSSIKIPLPTNTRTIVHPKGHPLFHLHQPPPEQPLPTENVFLENTFSVNQTLDSRW